MRWSTIVPVLAVSVFALAAAAQQRNQQKEETQRKEMQQKPQSKQDLAKSLNGDLSGEYQAVVMYQTYAAEAKGPERKQERSFFESAMKEEMKHAGLLADEVVSLDARPTTDVRSVPQAKSSREMMENALKAENKAIDDYKQRVRQADESGQRDLGRKLEEIVKDETDHRTELEKMMKSGR